MGESLAGHKWRGEKGNCGKSDLGLESVTNVQRKRFDTEIQQSRGRRGTELFFEEGARGRRESLSNYQGLLRAYHRKGHWSRVRNTTHNTNGGWEKGTRKKKLCRKSGRGKLAWGRGVSQQ